MNNPLTDFFNKRDAGNEPINARGITAVMKICMPFEKILFGYMAKLVNVLKISYTLEFPTHLNPLADIIKEKEIKTSIEHNKRSENTSQFTAPGSGICVTARVKRAIPPTSLPRSSISILVNIVTNRILRGLISRMSKVPSRILTNTFQTIPAKKGYVIPLDRRNTP